MATQPTAQPVIPDLPEAPNSITQTKSEFNIAAVDYVEAQVNYVPEQNTLAAWQNLTAQQVYDNAIEASSSATMAAQSEAAAASSSNFIGEWSNLTGSVTVGESVSNNGTFWRAVIAIADITTEEPSATSSVWVFTGGNLWLKTSISIDAIPNSKIQVSATTAGVDLQLVSMSVNDSVTIRNNSDSTEIVRLVNSTYEIIGSSGSISSIDNLTFKPKTTKTFVCRDTNVLEML